MVELVREEVERRSTEWVGSLYPGERSIVQTPLCLDHLSPPRQQVRHCIEVPCEVVGEERDTMLLGELEEHPRQLCHVARVCSPLLVDIRNCRAIVDEEFDALASPLASVVCDRESHSLHLEPVDVSVECRA